MNLDLLFRLEQPDAIVQEIVSALPDYLFESDNTTFLDPAMGGGDYLYAIASRLQSNGHPVDNIASRIYGIEENLIFVNRAKSRCIGNFMLMRYDEILNWSPDMKIENFMLMRYNEILNWSPDMKFDVIIGNPPYQDGSKSGKVNAGGGRRNLYTKFTMMALDYLKEDGFMAYIIPPGIVKSTSWGERSEVMNKILKKNLVLAHMKNISQYFDVGTFISYFIIQNNDEYVGTRIISETEYVADVRKWGFIPLYSNELTYSIIEKMTDTSNGEPMNWVRDAKSLSGEYLSMVPLQHVNSKKKGEINFAIGDKFAGRSGSLTYESDNV